MKEKPLSCVKDMGLSSICFHSQQIYRAWAQNQEHIDCIRQSSAVSCSRIIYNNLHYIVQVLGKQRVIGLTAGISRVTASGQISWPAKDFTDTMAGRFAFFWLT